MDLFSYIVAVDAGFAPNPFHGYCTLACCKPVVRRVARVGDWVIGLSRKVQGNKLIFAMRIEEKLSFEQYWRDRRFAKKRPKMASKQVIPRRGDNIYKPIGNGEFKQLWSGHSEENGSEKPNLKAHDLGGKFVLISKRFTYFGQEGIALPDGLEGCIAGRGHRRIRYDDDDDLWNGLRAFLDALPGGVRGKPRVWPADDGSRETGKPRSGCCGKS